MVGGLVQIGAVIIRLNKGGSVKHGEGSRHFRSIQTPRGDGAVLGGVASIPNRVLIVIDGQHVSNDFIGQGHRAECVDVDSLRDRAQRQGFCGRRAQQGAEVACILDFQVEFLSKLDGGEILGALSSRLCCPGMVKSQLEVSIRAVDFNSAVNAGSCIGHQGQGDATVGVDHVTNAVLVLVTGDDEP